jgi:hypothetical protein
MRALVLEKFGGLNSLVCEDIHKPGECVLQHRCNKSEFK